MPWTVTDDKIVNKIKFAKYTVNNLHYSSETEDKNDSYYSEYKDVSSTEEFNALKTERRFVMQAQNSCG